MSASTVLVLIGPGFGDQGDFIANLRGGGYTVKTAYISYETPVQSLPDFHDAGIVVLRAPWTTTADEKVLARLMALKLKPSFDILKKRLAAPKPPRFFAIGRGALIYFLSGMISEPDLEKQVSWDPIFGQEGPFVELRYNEEVFYGLVQGRLVPKIFAPETLGLRPIVNYRDNGVVWAHKSGESGSAVLSFVDIFACAERSQLVNFGYEDLMKVQTQVQIFEAFCGVP